MSFGYQETPYEQLASGYFFEYLFEKEFSDVEVIEFNGRTDTTGYYGVVFQCSNWNDSLKKQISHSQTKEIKDIDIPHLGLKVKPERKRSKRLKIRISPALEVKQRTFVFISVYKRMHFVNYYMFELNKEGQVVDICTTSEII